MDVFKQSLQATLTFLSKHEKLDKLAYDQIESAQVNSLLKQLASTNLALQDASELTELVQSSRLAEPAKVSLCKAISGSACKEVSSKGNKRGTQTMVSGFLNYLTKADKELLKDVDQHPFSRCAVAVARCMKVGLYLPDEKSCGHVVATLLNRFEMGSTPGDANDLLIEFKRLLRLSRGNARPEVFDFPSDPRSLPPSIVQQAYGNMEDLEPAAIAADRPGKWLRGTSKELISSRPSFGPSSSKNKFDPSWQSMMSPQQQMTWMQFQYNMMAMQHGMQTGQQPGGLSNLVMFPQRKQKALADGANGQGASGATLALQDKTVRNDEAQTPTTTAQGTPSPAPATPVAKEEGPAPRELFTVPDAKAAEVADQEVEEHAKTLTKAFAERAAAKKRPASKMDAKPKGAAKAKAKAKAKGKAKAKSNGKAQSDSKRPPPIPQGGSTCYYLCGKIHRSDSSQSWRTFKKASDRCDTKIAWKGNLKASWERALDLIESHAK